LRPRVLAPTTSSLPKLPASLVRRRRLEALLDDDVRRPVTLVSAVPGGGKTTLLASWARSRPPGSVAWLTLEEGDNGPGRLARAVVGALVTAGALPPPYAEAHDDHNLLDAALHEVPLRDGRTALVLDDVHVLTSADGVAVVDHLAWRAPPHVDVVLATRADPPLRLGRLRLEGRIGEVRNALLAFRRTEAAELFVAAGLRVRQDHLSEIHARTEGWAAGLRLVASALERGAATERFATDTGAAEAAVSDYLVEEVLAREDEDVQRFLLRTSVAERLTPELAALLSEDPRAGGRLGDLHRRGLFLVELEGRDWYRYHSLFGALLRARQRQQDLPLARALHARAARWYDEHDLPTDAEEHARLAEDWTLLGRLVGRRWVEATLEGERSPPDLLARLPQRAVAEHSDLALVAAAVAHQRGDHDVGQALAPAVRGSEVPVRMLELVRSRACGGVEGDRETVAALLRHTSPSGDARVRRWAALRAAELDLDLGALSRARAALGELADGGGSPAAVEAAGLLALAHAIDGELAPARSRATAVLARQTHSLATAVARLALALCDAQAGQSAAAGGVDRDALSPSRVLRALERAMAGAALGTAGPVAGLDAADVHHPTVQRMLVALGVLELVDASTTLVVLGHRAEAAVREARHGLDRGATGAAAAVLTPVAGRTPAHAHPRTAIEASSLAAVVAWEQRRIGPACRHLRDALARADATGIRAPLVVHGRRLEPLLAIVAAEPGSTQPVAVDLLDAVARLQSPAFVEPLTDQERVVLGFLPTLMSNSEIAAAMHLSVNTVKTHLKALYRKLAVERRRDAVVRARQLELLRAEPGAGASAARRGA
jgi:LuxR family maltose regulon positive regulatory protein